MPYDLTKPEDRARMMEDVDECAPPHTGYTPLRQIDAYNALHSALAAGYVLVPPVTPEVLDAVGDAIGSATAHRGLSLLDSERLRLAREVTAIARGGEK